MRYHDITKDDMRNGPGLRAVLWVSGCEHHCPGCHNPVTWDPEDGLEFNDFTRKELFEILGRDYISGLTLSGGDPLYPENRSEITELCHQVKSRFPNKSIWLYTGYDYEEVKSLPLMRDIDVVVDGRFMMDLADIKLHWRGSSNQRVIDVSTGRDITDLC